MIYLLTFLLLLGESAFAKPTRDGKGPWYPMPEESSADINKKDPAHLLKESAALGISPAPGELKGMSFCKEPELKSRIRLINPDGSAKHTNFPITVTAIVGPKPELVTKGYVVHYSGPNGDICGGACSFQGYTVVIDLAGKITEVLASSLLFGSIEHYAPKSLVNSLVAIINNKSQWQSILKKSNHPGKYETVTAAMSKDWGVNGGSTGMNFGLQIALVREKLGMKQWK